MARIVDLCGKSSGLVDFENTVDRGSAVTFDADSGFCLSYGRISGPKRNLDHTPFFNLGRYVNELIQIIYFYERSSLKLRCETVTGIVLRYSHQACRPLYYLKLCTSVFGCGCGFGFEQKFWRIDGFGEKKARIGGFVYPYSPPS